MRRDRGAGRRSSVVMAAISVLLAMQMHAGAAAQGGGGQAPEPAGPRIRALVVSGGCCHDYPLQARVIMSAISRALPVDWMVAVQGGRGTRGHMPVFESPDWARGYDIVIHNQCFADITDEAVIRRITAAHRGGPPAIVIHCAMHSFRTAAIDDWRQFLGVSSRRHTKPFPIPVKVAAPEHPAMKGFRSDWVTPIDELYVVDRFWPDAAALATAVSPEDGKEYPLVWANTYQGTRVFGTTLGHGNATFEDPDFQDLLVRGVRWALDR